MICPRIKPLHFALSLLVVAIALAAATNRPALAAEPIDVGSRRELLVDDFLVQRIEGEVTRQLTRPEPREVVLVTDQPWEGNTCAYYTIFQDGDLYRMYYRGSHYDTETKEAAHREVACYAESRDGIHWTKPELGLVEFDGSKANNIVWDGIGTHCFIPFRDTNPSCDPDAKYKAIARGRPKGKKGLYVFASPDGIRWRQLADEPVITVGDFDSQSLAFWDPIRKLYVDYHRRSRDGKRDIMTSTSQDFLTWTEPVFLNYTGAPPEHLYTNAIQRYARAPHLLVGFPTRYLPDTQQVAPTLMTSRDGLNFRRWEEELIPISAPEDRDGNRSNYMTHGILELPGSDRELSVYATEAYYTGPNSRVRRFAFRKDGFVAMRAQSAGGTVLTKPITYSGKQLFVNYAASDGGQVRVQLEDAAGKPLAGFGLADCQPLTGDEIEAPVRWNGGELPAATARGVRLRIELASADLYSFRFGP